MKVYLAHQVTKEDCAESECLHDSLRKFAHDLRELEIVLLDPARTEIPKEDYSSRFQYCLRQIIDSDAIVVDASTRLGVGVGAEMMFAKKLNKIVISVCPEPSYYRKHLAADGELCEWIHPFIHGLSTMIFDTFEECERELARLASTKVKDSVEFRV